MSSGKNTVTITADTSAIDAYMDQISGDLSDSVTPVAKAGAEVLYHEVRKNAVGVDSGKGHWFYGSSFKKTGQRYWMAPFTLRNSIYHAYSRDNSGENHTTYHVSWNFKKAPYAYMVEYGTSRAAAHPFVRPAQDKFPQAVEAMKDKFLLEMGAYV